MALGVLIAGGAAAGPVRQSAAGRPAMSETLLRCGETVEAEAMIVAALERAQVQRDPYDMADLLRTRAQAGLASASLVAAPPASFSLSPSTCPCPSG